MAPNIEQGIETRSRSPLTDEDGQQGKNSTLLILRGTIILVSLFKAAAGWCVGLGRYTAKRKGSICKHTPTSQDQRPRQHRFFSAVMVEPATKAAAKSAAAAMPSDHRGPK